jgi:hypothetical protein
MRTKVLLCAAAMAAGLASLSAQNVYSLNVVGYVNVTLPAQQFYAVANPLDASLGGTVAGGNDITNLFSTAAGNIAANSSIATFNSALVDYDPAITFNGKSGTWNANLAMPPGASALYFNAGATATVVTFVGQVAQGNYTVATLPAQAFKLAGSPVPLGGDISDLNTKLGLVPSANDSIATFNGATVDWNPAVTWNGKSSTWNSALTINPGQGFLYFNASASPKTWVSNFTVQ